MIGPGELHVWTDDLRVASSRVDTSILDSTEVARCDRLRLPAHRFRYAVRRALLRNALSWCDPTVPAGQWRFRTGPHGKPEVDPRCCSDGGTATHLRFNLAHASDWIAVVVTMDRACGVDIENLHRPLDLDRLMVLALDDAERLDVLRTDPADRPRQFLRRWTLKEAYLKGRGLGLDVPLHALRTGFAATGPFVHPGPHSQDASTWVFRQWTEADDRVLVALAVRAIPDSPLTLHRHGAVPDLPLHPPSRPDPEAIQEGPLPCTT